MMKNGAVNGRPLSKPEEKIIYQYIVKGTDDIRNFKPQYNARSPKLATSWIQPILFLIIITATTYVVLSFIVAPDRSVKFTRLTDDIVTLNDGTMATLQRGSELFYHESRDGRHIALIGSAGFEAAGDHSKPLSVSCGTSFVRVEFSHFYLVNCARGGDLIKL